jgi:hypothetical protein
MEYITKIKEAHSRDEPINWDWIIAVENIFKRKTQSCFKYSQTDKGRVKRREAQRRYMAKKRLAQCAIAKSE